MGIIAYCPNDHRVKVKNDLAGKKGICPTCGARFRIPFESQPDRKHVALDDMGPAEPEPAPVLEPIPAAGSIPVAEIISLDAGMAATLPLAIPLASPASD